MLNVGTHIRVYHERHFSNNSCSCDFIMPWSCPVYPWKHYGTFLFSKIFISTLPLAIKVSKLHWGILKSSCNTSFILGVYKMHLHQRIPDRISEFESDNTWSHFLLKTGQQPVKYPTLLIFDGFLGITRGKCYPISIRRPDLESSPHAASFRSQNERRVKTLICWPPL